MGVSGQRYVPAGLAPIRSLGAPLGRSRWMRKTLSPPGFDARTGWSWIIKQ